MNFTAAADAQWTFILAAVKYAESDGELGHIAAGPVEQLLSTHGQEYIDLVEQKSATEPKFAQMMKKVWRHMMTEEVWSRVSAIQCRMGIYYNRGFAFLKTGEFDNAITDLTEAIRRDPQRVENYGGRGMAYQKKGAFDEAIADFSEVVRLRPTYARAYYERGLAYQGKGEGTKAEEDFIQARKLGYKPG